MKQQNPLHTFIAYSRNDEAYLQKLKKHLKPFVRKNEIKVWYDGEMIAGTYWNEAITEKLENADIVLLLVSTDSLYSDYFYEKEMQQALARHQKDLLVIPIILKPCLWEDEIELSNIQALPKDGTAITKWLDKDEAYVNIAKGIKASFPRARNLRAERRKRQEKKRNDKILILERKLKEKEEELKMVLEENERLKKLLEKEKWKNARLSFAQNPEGVKENKNIKHIARNNIVLRKIKRNNKYGFQNKQGKIIINTIYNNAFDFSEGLASVKKNNKWGFIDKKGNIVIDFIYDSAYSFSEGLAKVQHKSKSGFIDQKGNIVIDFIYNNAYSFSEGLAKVQKDKKWGFINKEGYIIIDFVYDNISSFSKGLAEVQKNKKWFHINKKGERVEKM